MEKTISAANFKAKCLQIMDSVQEGHTEIVITKRGRPVAKLVPYEASPPAAFGFMAGTGSVHGDILEPLDEAWDAENQ
ncbi:type II toxin-antitoxin system Phd/YefM family antitoxin [bacterium]|nr:type II toxin-antitoxin system Phd/YefM family antitoxin [bacterium]